MVHQVAAVEDLALAHPPPLLDERAVVRLSPLSGLEREVRIGRQTVSGDLEISVTVGRLRCGRVGADMARPIA